MRADWIFSWCERLLHDLLSVFNLYLSIFRIRKKECCTILHYTNSSYRIPNTKLWICSATTDYSHDNNYDERVLAHTEISRTCPRSRRWDSSGKFKGKKGGGKSQNPGVSDRYLRLCDHSNNRDNSQQLWMLQAVKGCKVGVFSTAEKRVPNYCHNCYNREAVHANKFDPYYSLSLSLSVSTSTSTSISLLMFQSLILFSSLLFLCLPIYFISRIYLLQCNPIYMKNSL